MYPYKKRHIVESLLICRVYATQEVFGNIEESSDYFL